MSFERLEIIESELRDKRESKSPFNPILIACLQKPSKPGHKHRHSSSECQFDTYLTGIGLNNHKKKIDDIF